MKRISTYLYIIVVSLVVVSFCILFNLFPRSTVSELEGRELAKFPAFTWEKFWSGKYMSELSSWYSDSEPYRDRFMTLSMEVDKAKKLNLFVEEEDAVTFIAGDDEEDTATEQTEVVADAEIPQEAADSLQQMAAAAKSKIANSGIVLVGSEPTVRAMMAYRNKPTSCNSFAEMANRYKRTLGEGVNVYCMIIPTAVDAVL